MKSNALIEKIKYGLAPFVILALLSLIYDGFNNPVVLLVRILLCLSAALLFLFVTDKDDDFFIPSFAFLSIISGNTIFLTEDIHILLSLMCFFLSLVFTEKVKFLSPLFAFLCVMAQPLSVLFFVPAIISVLLFRKQKISAVISAVSGIVAFIITKLLESSEFYADQFSSYHLAVHLVHFSNQHLEVLSDFIVSSIPLVAVLIFLLLSLFLKKKFLAGVLVAVTLLLSVFAFALSKNHHTVIFTLIPVFSVFLLLRKTEPFENITKTFNVFCQKHLFLFLLFVIFTAGYPLLFGQIPFDSDFFSRVTFIIFRQE